MRLVSRKIITVVLKRSGWSGQGDARLQTWRKHCSVRAVPHPARRGDDHKPVCLYTTQDLIKWGLPHDVWFHVDALSSAHVYLRLPRGAAWDAIPPETLEDCVTLVKANSIEVPPVSAVP